MSEWWQGRRHSTEDLNPPPPLKVEPKKIADLLKWAEENFGYDAVKVKHILVGYGHEKFFSACWWTYTLLIRYTWDCEQAGLLYPQSCPVCGAEIVRDDTKDHRYGVIWGWKCTADRFHFMETVVRKLNARLDRRQDNNTIGRVDSEGILSDAAVPAP